MTFAFDTESTYEKGRDIRTLGVKKYVQHPNTDHYLASAFSPTISVCKFPEDFPWEIFDRATVLAHNAAYDKSVVEEIRRRKIFRIPEPQGWICTADMVAYLQCARSLQSATACLYGIETEKEMRASMKGRTWNDLDAPTQKKLAKYCLHDSELCFKLWQDFSSRWPQREIEASQHTILMCNRGIAVDLKRIKWGLDTLWRAMQSAEKRIPWAGRVDEKGKEMAITSPKEIRKHCLAEGIPVPETTDAKSEDFQAWLNAFEDQAGFVQAVQEWRSANRLRNVLQTMLNRQTGGILSYSLKYFGAPHTGRWSGDAGLNMHNFPKKPVADVDGRACLIPRPGYKFVCADLAQIEARVALWIAQNWEMLDLLESGIDIYEAHARLTMGYTDKRPLKDVDDHMRQLAKCRVLGLGFGLGPEKFMRIVKQWTGETIKENDAIRTVKQYRRSNPGIVKCWKTLEDTLRDSRGGDMETILPSGRSIKYFEVTEEEPLCGRVEMGAPTKKLWGGLLFENAVQATARDLFAEVILRAETAGFPVVLHVHDEIVCEVPEPGAESHAREIKMLVERRPEWAQDLPILSEVTVRNEYGK